MKRLPLGVNAGAKWNTTTSESVNIAADTLGVFPASSLSVPNQTASSGIGGGQVGCNWQSSQFVFGIEGDADGQHTSSTYTVGPVFPFLFVPGDNFTVTSNWQASIRGRLGYAVDRTLFYAKGGIAFTNVRFGTDFIACCGGFPASVVSDNRTLVGATVGGGLEYAITNTVSLGVEGRFTWLRQPEFQQWAARYCSTYSWRPLHLHSGDVVAAARQRGSYREAQLALQLRPGFAECGHQGARAGAKRMTC